MAELQAGDQLLVSGVRLSSENVDARVLPQTTLPDVADGSVLPALADLGMREDHTVGVEPRVVTPTSRSIRRGADGGRPDVGTLVLDVPPPGPDQGQVLLVDHGGAVSWHLPEAPTGVSRSVRGAASTRFRLPLVPAEEESGAASRGLVGAVARRVLHVLTFDLIDKVAGKVGESFVRNWEERQRPHRLRSFSPADYRRRDVAALDAAAVRGMSGGRVLLVVHGTNSLSHSGFAALPPEAVAGLHSRYGGRVLAFDHPTLSVDPLENCKALAALLPTDVQLEVDVLCHSRGGLVARCLTELADQAGTSGKLKVRQVVFVATPSRGTPLADPEHLGRLLDGLTNLLDFIPDNPITDSLAGIVTVVKQFAVSGAKGLDGLMAMSPRPGDNAFLTQLNQPRQVAARYRALATDYEPPAGTALARVARDTLVDGIFGWEPNDLIVPTASAYSWNGASGFPVSERVVLPTTRGVQHSTFWTAPEVLDAFADWLAADDSALRPRPQAAPVRLLPQADPLVEVDERLAAGDVDGVREAVRGLPSGARRTLEQQVGELALDSFVSRGVRGPKRGTVLILPGLMGSDLYAGAEPLRERIWLDPIRLVAGDFLHLKVTDGPGAVTAGGLYRSYLPLVVAADHQWDVVPVGFDWRLSLEDSAQHLADRLREVGGGEPRPAHLVAHSMGGMVARMLVAQSPDVWRAIDSPEDRSKGGRLVMLGTPNLGSFAVARALTGDESLVRWLARATWGSLREIRQVIATFPGFYQLLTAPNAPLPIPDSEHAQLYTPESWEEGFISGPLLDRAAATHALLTERGLDGERMYYIAGTGHDTPAAVRISGPGRFQYRRTKEGDGRVPHALGIPLDGEGRPAFKAWYSTADHGDLTKDRRAIDAVLDLLRTGATEALPTTPPVRARGVAAVEPKWIPSELMDPVEPDPVTEQVLRSPAVSRTERRAAAQTVADRAVEDWLGSRPMAEPAVPVLRLSVLHASLEHSTYPVLVGHYRGDPIAGAEGHLDWRLDRRLSQRQVLDRYPREIGDVLRVTTDGGLPPGAIVVGLGASGELTPTGLARAVRDAALEHALAWLERPQPRLAVDDGVIGLSSVVIGSYGDAGLTLPTSLAAIVEGVVLANGLLSERQLADRVRIGALEIVERYAAPAEAAVQVVRDIELHLPAVLRATVALRPEPYLILGEGRRPAVHTPDYNAGLWHRLIVTSDEKDADGRMRLHFTSLGSRARADQLAVDVDTNLVSSMLHDAVTQTAVDEQVNIALFEMLLPNDVKRELAAVENVQFVLDERTADFPWEALIDRGGLTGAGPLARRAGLLRQLRLDTNVRLDPPSGTESALVIGDPPGGKRFPRLEGARREAEEVAGLLAGVMSVERRIFPAPDPANPAGSEETDSATKILGALLADDYRIIHISAHGFFNEREAPQKPLGGVVIGPEVYLTADQLRSLRRPPDIVFLNCCHLGSVGAAVIDETAPTAPPPEAFARRNLHELAASLSRELMSMGVKAVVAAGWSVADRAAAVFARVFYERMLAGAMFGDAVRSARDAAFQADGGASNTWAAYQCYGDPGYRLVNEGRVRRPITEPVSAEDLVRRLEEIQVSAGDAGPSVADDLAARVDGLRALTEKVWPARARAWSALAEAYSALAKVEAAVSCYRTALACRFSELPIRSVEQLAVQEYRLAMMLRREGEARAEGLTELSTEEELRQKAHERLDALDKLGETAERHSIRAGWHKRRAVTLSSAEQQQERQEALTASAQEYLRAWQLSDADPERRDPYGALNALQLVALGASLDEGDRRQLERCLEPDEVLDRTESFWDRVAAADRELTSRLLSCRLEAEADHVVAAYSKVFEERSTPSERKAVRDHIAELAELAGEGQKAGLVAVYQRLEELQGSPT